MIRSLGLLAVLVAFSGATAQDVQKPTLKVMAFHVTKSDGAPAKSDDRGPGARADRDLGTRVVVRVEVPGRQLISFDTKASKVESFTDDKDTDLAAVPAGSPAPTLLEVERASIRTRTNDVTFHAPNCPAKGAAKVRIKGSVVAVVGKDEKEIEKKEFAGSAEFEFGKMVEQKGGFGGNQLTYDGDKPLKSVSFVDADGKTVACTLSTSPFGAAAARKTAYRNTIRAAGNVAIRGTLRVKYFDSTENVTVPVDLEVGPGF
jgi:hypothetical protein